MHRTARSILKLDLSKENGDIRADTKWWCDGVCGQRTICGQDIDIWPLDFALSHAKRVMCMGNQPYITRSAFS